MSNWFRSEGSVFQCILDLIDVSSDLGRAGPNATVVFNANRRDTIYNILELGKPAN